MRKISLNGTVVWLVTEPPDWSSPVEGRFTIVSGVETGLTRREIRRRYSRTLRCRLRYELWVVGARARALHAALRLVASEPVLMPFWPAATEWSRRMQSPVSSGWQAVWKADGSVWTVFAAGDDPAEPGPTDVWAPLLWGDLGTQQMLHWLHDELLQWSVEFNEGGPPEYALVPRDFIAPPGPASPVSGVTPPLLPFVPQWENPSEQLQIHWTRRTTGFRRQRTPTVYPQAVAQSGVQRFLLPDPASIWQWVRFALDHAGGAPFWMPSWNSVLRLARDIQADQTAWDVTDTSAVQLGDFLGILSGPWRLGRRIASIGSSTQLTLDAPAGADCPADTTLITRLLWVVLDSPEWTVEWTHSHLAFGQWRVREVPSEYRAVPDPPVPATRTFGQFPERAVLFCITSWVGDAATSTWWTSYESDLEWAGHHYLSVDISHGEVLDSLDLERTGVELVAQRFDGNPLLPWVTLSAEGPMTVKILWATVNDGRVVDAKPVFTGEVVEAGIQGSIITARCRPGGGRWDASWPRMVRGPLCNATLFHDGCHLRPEDWRWRGRIASPVDPAWPFVLNIQSLTAPAPDRVISSDGFAGGWAEWGSGPDLQRRPIVQSSAPTAGTLALKLGRWFSSNPLAGDAIAVLPGCDQQRSTCLNRFGNLMNFRGHPFIPAGNPTLVQRSDVTSRGKK